ncbi:MAG: 2-C-methyl-D-erythritol 4-phosphate cytidylyltransferase [Deltaproteobacteria bacterium]|jgi:2-C-methyl-D-erythritol 4-phosphate cytidylyltransferase|nr:2-C-methyl-D-erythritol 4-phosphate cytidylyltransferase [Deltaproteobacteria bacterium]
MMKADAIIVSAGKGQRFMEGRKKQFFFLGGKPILAHTLDQFDACPLIRSILLVVGQEDQDYCLKEIIEKFQYRKISQIIPGGKRRQDSVRNGLDALSADAKIIVIHDGVRPFVTKEMIEESIRSATRFGAAIIAMPVKDTIKMAHPDGTVLKTLERESLYQAQTPQAFQAPFIREAYLKATEDGFIGTDDASLVERLGKKIHILPGAYTNIKITTLEDLMLANLILKMRAHTKGEEG